MSKEMVLFILLVSAFAVALTLALLCVRYYFVLRHARRRLRLSDARFALYRRRLAGARAGLAGGRARAATGKVERVMEAEPEVDLPAPPELRARLQQRQPCPSGMIERYRLVASMARRGLSAEDISEVLQMPFSETEQLLKLSRVSRAGS